MGVDTGKNVGKTLFSCLLGLVSYFSSCDIFFILLHLFCPVTSLTQFFDSLGLIHEQLCAKNVRTNILGTNLGFISVFLHVFVRTLGTNSEL